MNDIHCWLCRRNAESLIKDLPGMFRSDSEVFLNFTFLGEVLDVQKRTANDVMENNTYVRKENADGTAAYYDQAKDAMVVVTKLQVPICRMCWELMPKPRYPHPSMEAALMSIRRAGLRDILDQHGMIEQHEKAVDGIWSKKLEEQGKLEMEFPPTEFRVLLMMKGANHQVPLNIQMVSSSTGLEAGAVLQSLKSILRKNKDLGEIFEDSYVFMFNRTLEVKGAIENLISAYRKNPENIEIEERFLKEGTLRPAPTQAAWNQPPPVWQGQQGQPGR